METEVVVEVQVEVEVKVEGVGQGEGDGEGEGDCLTCYPLMVNGEGERGWQSFPTRCVCVFHPECAQVLCACSVLSCPVSGWLYPYRWHIEVTQLTHLCSH